MIISVANLNTKIRLIIIGALFSVDARPSQISLEYQPHRPFYHPNPGNHIAQIIPPGQLWPSSAEGYANFSQTTKHPHLTTIKTTPHELPPVHYSNPQWNWENKEVIHKKPYAVSSQQFTIHFPPHHHYQHQPDHKIHQYHPYYPNYYYQKGWEPKKPCNESDDKIDDKSNGNKNETDGTNNGISVDLSEMSSSNSTPGEFLDLFISQNATRETTFLTHNVTVESDNSGLDATRTTNQSFSDSEAVTEKSKDDNSTKGHKTTYYGDKEFHSKWTSPHSFLPLEGHKDHVQHVYPKYTVFLPFHLVPARHYPPLVHYPPHHY